MFDTVIESKETVTITLEKYDAMKAEIATLKRKVVEQTIVKEVYPDVFYYIQHGVYLVVAIALCYFFSSRL